MNIICDHTFTKFVRSLHFKTHSSTGLLLNISYPVYKLGRLGFVCFFNQSIILGVCFCNKDNSLVGSDAPEQLLRVALHYLDGKIVPHKMSRKICSGV
jgi:hypothetical protein